MQDLLNYHDIVSSKLAGFTKPALAELGIDYFCYQRFMDGNQYLMFTDRPARQVVLPVLEQKLDKLMVRWNIPTLPMGKSIVIWPGGPVEEILHNYHIGYGCTVYIRDQEMIRAYSFCADFSNPSIINTYTNSQECIDRFIVCFDHYLEQVLSDAKAPIFTFSDGMKLELNSIEPTVKQQVFLKNNLPKKFKVSFRGETALLTPKEIEILTHLSKGGSTKLIAQEQKISFRTVEGRLDKIKTKFGLSSKHELIDLINSNSLLKSLMVDES